MKQLLILSMGLLFLVSCKPEKTSFSSDGLKKIEQDFPLLGHRNWIVVTDMAYPLQTKEGVLTYYADKPYTEVVRWVKSRIGRMPHVYAHVYRDEEYRFLNEDICPGIEELKKEMEQCIPEDSVVFCRHEELLTRMDSVSNLYRVIVIKTPLLKPYTSVFWELDCKYWGQEKQLLLQEKMQ